MKKYLEVIWHTARYTYYRNKCFAIGTGVGLIHEQLMWTNDSYYNAFRKYNESKKRLTELGAFKFIPHG